MPATIMTMLAIGARALCFGKLAALVIVICVGSRRRLAGQARILLRACTR